MKLIQTMVAPVVLCITLLAQEPPATSPGTGGGQARAAKVRSPEVLADGRITFRLLAPKATEVLVQGNWEGGRGLAMTKDDSGLWSITTPALQPELWAYTFSVDGVRALDPNNYNVARDVVVAWIQRPDSVHRKGVRPHLGLECRRRNGPDT